MANEKNIWQAKNRIPMQGYRNDDSDARKTAMTDVKLEWCSQRFLVNRCNRLETHP